MVEAPSLKSSLLHKSEASIYTEKEESETITFLSILFSTLYIRNSLCSPVLTPQIIGGVLFPGLVTVNASVSQWPYMAASPPPVLGEPFKRNVLFSVLVLGWAIVKVLKSSLS